MVIAKIASKRVVKKTAEAAGDLIGNKIADKITSIGKTKEKQKQKQKNGRNICSTRKETTNYYLNAPTYKNGISKNCKFS